MASFELISFPHPNNPPAASPPAAQMSVNNDMHLIHTLAGSGTARIAGKTYRMTPRTVIFIEPHVEYSVSLQKSERLEMINFHFHLFLDSGVPFTRAQGLPSSFSPRKLPRIHQDLRRWHRWWQGTSPLQRAAVVAALHALVIRYLREFQLPPAGAPQDPLAGRLAQLLSERQRVNFDAGVCAEELFVSVSQMNRRFRQTHGTSPKDFWLRHRYLQARAQLHYSVQPVSAIALEMGFNDANYFSRWFKRMSGASPQQFRQRIRQQQM